MNNNIEQLITIKNNSDNINKLILNLIRKIHNQSGEDDKVDSVEEIDFVFQLIDLIFSNQSERLPNQILKIQPQ